MTAQGWVGAYESAPVFCFFEVRFLTPSLTPLPVPCMCCRESNKLRRGHIPYRDSKLTRILQHSLGGNARTAIICTMSPARAHVEQTRNTLSFATRAKEVTNSAHINLVSAEWA